MGRKAQPNLHCPVPGCRTAKPHRDDPLVRGLINMFAPPMQMTFWARGAMVELRDSICADLRDKRMLAFQTRLRQPEELYIRTLNALFVASEAELPHIISGDMPNGLYGLYVGVNKVVFEGGGALLVSLPGLNYGTFTPMDTLNDGAHVSFQAFAACIGWAAHPENVPSVDAHWKYLTVYCDSLNYMYEMFKAGKEREHILVGVRNFHRPAQHGVRPLK